MCLKVVVLWQDTGSYKLFLQDVHKVQQILGLAATNVIDCVGRDGQAVFTRLLFGGFGQHTDNAFHNVIHVGEVAAAVAVVVYLDSFATQQLIGKSEVSHVGATGRAIDSEEAEAGTRDVIELAVAMCHQFVALLGSGIEADRIVHTVIGAERHLLVSAIDATGTAEYQMLHGIVAASFEDIVETNDVALNVDVRILDAVAHTGLGRKVDHDIELVLSEELVDKFLVSKTPLTKA